MRFLNNLSVRKKLSVIIFLLLGLTITMEGINLLEYKHQLEQSRIVQSREIVSTAHAITDYYYRQSRSGTLDTEQAQQLARTAIAAMRYDGDNYIFIGNLQGVVVEHPITPSLNGKNLRNSKDASGFLFFQALVDMARAEGKGVVPYHWARPGSKEPVAKISYVQRFSPWNWIIVTGVYVDDIEQLFLEQLLKTAAILFVGIPIIMLIAFRIARCITAPLAEITTVMRQVAKGNLTGQVHNSNRDELGTLAKNVNQTVDELRTLIQQVGSSCVQIREASEGAAATTAQTFAGVKRQHEETEALATAMHEMAMTAQEVADTAERTAASSHDADDAAHEGNRIVDTTIGRINDVADEMQRLLVTISQLERDTEEVENILNIISEISDQTNLLALNAAIEAARAGDQGRGFAVVADEVRQLAKRTQESTEQIRELNERLKSACHNAVAMMKNGHEHTQNSASSAQDAGTYIHTIVDQVNAILDMNTLVATAVKEQSAVAEDMNRNITTISQIAEETSQGAHETAETSKDLAALARQLENRLDAFKI
ncbi:MAG: methyl-accepting chemotaxis protein [Marinobacterium sp.]|nr:methyl-accepting chemotaxis protein [Marinobacterium sp.]